MAKEFTEADLKAGMVVQYRNKGLRMVVELDNGELGLVGNASFANVGDYRDDLIEIFGNTGCDICIVYSLCNNWKDSLTIGRKGRTVLFERKEPLKMNIEEAQEKLTELLEKEVEIVLDTDEENEDEEW